MTRQHADELAHPYGKPAKVTSFRLIRFPARSSPVRAQAIRFFGRLRDRHRRYDADARHDIDAAWAAGRQGQRPHPKSFEREKHQGGSCVNKSERLLVGIALSLTLAGCISSTTGPRSRSRMIRMRRTRTTSSARAISSTGTMTKRRLSRRSNRTPVMRLRGQRWA